MRRVITRVLPLPAPATTKRGPSIWVIASRCLSVTSIKRDICLCSRLGISIFCNSPLKRGDFVVSAQSNDKGVCKFTATHPQPLFLEGSLKVAAFGSLIYFFCNQARNSLFVIQNKFPIINDFKVSE